MVRTAVFDPTDKDGFIEQRQRFDWTLLQNGTVFRYEAAFHLDSACDRLAALGYLVHRIDGDDWTSTGDMYDAFARAMSYDPDYGRGPDAFVDTLRDVAAFTFGSDPSSTGTVLGGLRAQYSTVHGGALVPFNRKLNERNQRKGIILFHRYRLVGHPWQQ